MPFLSVEGLTLRPDDRLRGAFPAVFASAVTLEAVNFSIARHETLALVGEEGSGKGEIAAALLSLRPVREGRLIFSGVEVNLLSDRKVHRLRKRIQGVFSDSFGQLTAEFTVDEMFREVLCFWYPGEARDYWHERVERVMIACGLPEAVRPLYPGELDEVERQEVALARALLLEPEFLILYEFTSGMDAVQQAELLDRIRSVKEEFELTLLVFTDDLAVAHQLGDAIGVLHRGEMIELSPALELIERPVHEYTKRLVSCSL